MFTAINPFLDKKGIPIKGMLQNAISWEVNSKSEIVQKNTKVKLNSYSRFLSAKEIFLN